MEEASRAQFEHSYSDEANVDEVLLGMAIRGVCSGPLAQQFSGKPEELGAFCARIVNGAHRAWYPDSAD